MVKLLKANGFNLVEGGKGSYLEMKKPGAKRPIIIPKGELKMVFVDIDEYLGGQELIKKTLSIPKWSNDLGNRLNLNFSKVLTEAIEKIALK